MGGLSAKIQLFPNMVMLHLYQIKGNDAFSNKVANILAADTLSTLGMASKDFFSESRHIKLKGMELKKIVCL